MIEALVGQVGVESADRGRRAVAAGTVPRHDDVPIARGLGRGEEARREVVAEAFAHGRGLRGRAEVWTDGVLERVPELVEHRLSVLGIVDVARAEGERALARAVPGVVVAGAARVHPDRLVEHAPAAAIAEALQVDDGLVDVVIGGDLLEARVRARHDEVEPGPRDPWPREPRGHATAVEPAMAAERCELHGDVGEGGRPLDASARGEGREVVSAGHGIGQEDAGPARGLGEVVHAGEDPPADRVHVGDDLGARLRAVDADAPRGMEEAPRGEPQELRAAHHAGVPPRVADGGEGAPHRASGGETRLLGSAQNVLGHGAALHEIDAAIAADVHADVGAVDAPTAPNLLVDHVIGAQAVEHAPQIEAIQLGGDAEELAIGREEFPGDAARRAGASLAPEAPELFGGGVALPGDGVEGAGGQGSHDRRGGCSATNGGAVKPIRAGRVA